MGYFGGVGLILLQAAFGVLMFVAVLRVLLPLSGARFRNPICQLIYKATNPVLVPLTRAIPNFRGVSVAGILLAWIIALLGLVLLVVLLRWYARRPRSAGYGGHGFPTDQSSPVLATDSQSCIERLLIRDRDISVR